MRFDASSLEVGPIREDQEYGGVRVVVIARVTNARIRLQIDVGFGDVITPEAEIVDFPVLLDHPGFRLRAYPRETVVAEKVEAMVKLDQANSRMKDFYDLVVLSRDFGFEGEPLVRAIVATFSRRGTPLPSALPVALTAEFFADGAKNTQWKAFLRKSGASKVGLPDVAAAIARFIEGPLAAASGAGTFDARWRPGGPWGPGGKLA